jgi:hypothetical protein
MNQALLKQKQELGMFSLEEINQMVSRYLETDWTEIPPAHQAWWSDLLSMMEYSGVQELARVHPCSRDCARSH